MSCMLHMHMQLMQYICMHLHVMCICCKMLIKIKDRNLRRFKSGWAWLSMHVHMLHASHMFLMLYFLNFWIFEFFKKIICNTMTSSECGHLKIFKKIRVTFLGWHVICHVWMITGYVNLFFFFPEQKYNAFFRKFSQIS